MLYYTYNKEPQNSIGNSSGPYIMCWLDLAVAGFVACMYACCKYAHKKHIRACVRVYIHPSIQTYRHIYIHTYILQCNQELAQKISEKRNVKEVPCKASTRRNFWHAWLGRSITPVWLHGLLKKLPRCRGDLRENAAAPNSKRACRDRETSWEVGGGGEKSHGQWDHWALIIRIGFWVPLCYNHNNSIGNAPIVKVPKTNIDLSPSLWKIGLYSSLGFPNKGPV